MNAPVQTETAMSALGLRLRELLEAQPRMRLRSAARELDTNELALTCVHPSWTVRLLEGDVRQWMELLPRLGQVKALTRNDEVVIETHGAFARITLSRDAQTGLCTGHQDMRYFLRHWAWAVHVRDPQASRQCESLQFFSRSGDALHKIFTTDETDMDAWRQVIGAMQTRPRASVPLATPPAAPSPKPPEWVDQDELRRAWSGLKDVHQFHAMLSRLGLDRITALKHIGRQWAWPVALTSLERLLQQCAQRAIPIMAFVGNPGVVQIYTGTVGRLLRAGPWYNVLDPDFNLHVNTPALSEAWIVRRPTTDGIITSLELYNSRQQLVLTLFGARKPGQPERREWREVAEQCETV
ncbi:ChuX/HutX family heme-like substrate-binding protein [Hahella sp. SMD15-11]|uniref:ChuX/HutX family heme-like substrate-binding protein n=1 Tax=Thermohahella caldifontis TaxID=3142973 RepID=A0AB39USZ8_9GAMM